MEVFSAVFNIMVLNGQYANEREENLCMVSLFGFFLKSNPNQQQQNPQQANY